MRDGDGDGVAETKSAFVEKLTSPFGMALDGDQLCIANADAIVRVSHVAGETRSAATPVKLADLPASRNHHWIKSLLASPDGSKLHVGVGSNSNVGENGMAEEEQRAAVLENDTRTGASPAVLPKL